MDILARSQMCSAMLAEYHVLGADHMLMVSLVTAKLDSSCTESGHQLKLAACPSLLPTRHERTICESLGCWYSTSPLFSPCQRLGVLRPRPPDTLVGWAVGCSAAVQLGPLPQVGATSTHQQPRCTYDQQTGYM